MERPQQNLIDLPNGMRVHEHGDTSVIIKEIWQEKSYQNLRDVKTGDVVFDIGANQGIFSLYAASKGAKVYAVEPDPDNFEVLQKNILLNNLVGIVIPIHSAVASQSGFLTLYIPERDGQTLTGLITTTKRVSEQYSDMDITALRECQVKAVRLSELFAQYQIPRVDLLKIDCEGAELDILSGGDSEDFKIVRHIIMETHAGYSEAALYKKVQSLGFQVVSYQKISGVYSTGYLWAESLQTAQEVPYDKPVAIAQLSPERTLGDIIRVDASNSFSTDPNNDELLYECFLNGQPMPLSGLNIFSAVIEQKNLNSVVLKVIQGESISQCELNFWAFEKKYGVLLVEPQPLLLTTDKNIRLNGKQHFVLPSSEMPKSWECRYLYLSVKINDWYLQDEPKVDLLFNGDVHRLSSQQKTFEFPFFSSESDFFFSLQCNQEVDITLRCFVLEKEVQKTEDDNIDLGVADHFLLPLQGQRYLCHANSKSTFEFEFHYDGWVPNCIKVGLGVNNNSANTGELIGQLKVGENTQSLNGWYRELKFVPPFESSTIKLELSVPMPRDYLVAWWPE